MKMDNEFFRSDVTDEWNTPAMPATAIEDSQQSAGRKNRGRKALQLVAPAAAVVMAAIIIAAQASHCPVCGQKDCRYYYDNVAYSGVPFRAPSQRILDQDLPNIEPGKPTGENRMGYRDFAISGADNISLDSTHYLNLDNNQVALMHQSYTEIREQISRAYSSLTIYDPHSVMKDGVLRPQRLGYSAVEYQATGYGEDIFYVELLYLPLGEVPDAKDYPESGTGTLPLNSYSYSTVQAYPGCEGLWVRAYSNTPALLPEKLIEMMDISVQPAPSQTISLGGTMTLEYDTSETLLFETIVDQPLSVAISGSENLSANYTNSCSRIENFPSSEYRFQYQIGNQQPSQLQYYFLCFSQKDYHDVISRFNFLYDAAPASGHYQLFHFIPLASETINNITYDVYVEESTSDLGETFYKGYIWLIPQQEPTFCIKLPFRFFSLGASEAAIAPGTSLSSISNVGYWRQLLSNISLSNSDSSQSSQTSQSQSGTEQEFVDYFTKNGLPVEEGVGPVENTAIAYMPDDPSVQKVVPSSVQITTPIVETGADGYKTVRQSVRTVIRIPLSDFEAGYTSVSFSNSLYDLYTGYNFPSKTLSYDESFDYSAIIEFDGREYDVSYTKENIWDWTTDSAPTGGERIGICTTMYTMRMPQEYDGVVYGAIAMTQYIPSESSDFDEQDSYAMDIAKDSESDLSASHFFRLGYQEN